MEIQKTSSNCDIILPGTRVRFKCGKYRGKSESVKSRIDDDDRKNACKRQLEGYLPEVAGGRDQDEQGRKSQHSQGVGPAAQEHRAGKNPQSQNGPPNSGRSKSRQQRIDDTTR